MRSASCEWAQSIKSTEYVLEFLRVVSCDKNVFANMISMLQINIISCFNKDQRKTFI